MPLIIVVAFFFSQGQNMDECGTGGRGREMRKR